MDEEEDDDEEDSDSSLINIYTKPNLLPQTGLSFSELSTIKIVQGPFVILCALDLWGLLLLRHFSDSGCSTMGLMGA